MKKLFIILIGALAMISCSETTLVQTDETQIKSKLVGTWEMTYVKGHETDTDGNVQFYDTDDVEELMVIDMNDIYYFSDGLVSEEHYDVRIGDYHVDNENTIIGNYLMWNGSEWVDDYNNKGETLRFDILDATTLRMHRYNKQKGYDLYIWYARIGEGIDS